MTGKDACQWAIDALGHYGFWDSRPSGRIRMFRDDLLTLRYSPEPDEEFEAPLLLIEVAGQDGVMLAATEVEGAFNVILFTPGPWQKHLQTLAAPPSPQWREVPEFDNLDPNHHRVALELVESIAMLSRELGTVRTVEPSPGKPVEKWIWDGIPRLLLISYRDGDTVLGVEAHSMTTGFCAFEYRLDHETERWRCHWWTPGAWIDTVHEHCRHLKYRSAQN